MPENWTDLGVLAAGETQIVASEYLGNGIVLLGTYPTGKIHRSTNYGVDWDDQGRIVEEKIICFGCVTLVVALPWGARD